MRVVKLKSKHRRLKAVFFAAVVIGAFALYYYLRIAPVISTVVTETTRMKVSEAIDDMTENSCTKWNTATSSYSARIATVT